MLNVEISWRLIERVLVDEDDENEKKPKWWGVLEQEKKRMKRRYLIFNKNEGSVAAWIIIMAVAVQYFFRVFDDDLFRRGDIVKAFQLFWTPYKCCS